MPALWDPPCLRQAEDPNGGKGERWSERARARILSIAQQEPVFPSTNSDADACQGHLCVTPLATFKEQIERMLEKLTRLPTIEVGS